MKWAFKRSSKDGMSNIEVIRGKTGLLAEEVSDSTNSTLDLGDMSLCAHHALVAAQKKDGRFGRRAISQYSMTQASVSFGRSIFRQQNKSEMRRDYVPLGKTPKEGFPEATKKSVLKCQAALQGHKKCYNCAAMFFCPSLFGKTHVSSPASCVYHMWTSFLQMPEQRTNAISVLYLLLLLLFFFVVIIQRNILSRHSRMLLKCSHVPIRHSHLRCSKKSIVWHEFSLFFFPPQYLSFPF